MKTFSLTFYGGKMKTLSITKTFFLFLFSVSIFNSCNLFFNDTLEAKPALSKGESCPVLIKVSVPRDVPVSSVSSTNERSIMPSLSGLKYDATASASGATTVSAKNQSADISLTLTTGHDWQITITAHETGKTDIILIGKTSIDLRATNIFSKEVSLQCYTESDAKNGSINFDTGSSSTLFTHLAFSLKNSEGSEMLSMPETGPTLEAIDKEYSVNKNKYKPGIYTLSVFFYKGSGTDKTLVYALNTGVTVYPTLTSNTWANDKGGSDSVFTLTQSMISSFAGSTFFVCGSGAKVLTSTPSDENIGSATKPFASVSRAVSMCTDSSKEYTIYVDGTVTESKELIISGQNVSIKGWGNTATIKKADDWGDKTFLLSIKKEGTVESSVKVSNILFDGNKTKVSGAFGGGIYCEASTVVLEKCTIQNFVTKNPSNTDPGADVFEGGGVSIDSSSNAVFTKCKIYNNEAKNGGGIYVGTDCSATLTDCIIKGNKAFQENGNSGYGGGIFMYGNVTLNNSTDISNNSAALGGGIYINILGDSPSLTVTEKCTIQENTASGDGGGIFACGQNKDDSVYAVSGTVANNSATGDNSLGGGIYVQSCTVTLNGNVTGNSAKDGGGVYISPDPTAKLNFESGVIEENLVSSGGTGSGVYVNKGSDTFGDFYMSGSSIVGVDNDVYLTSGTKITVAGELTGITPVATITPESYAVDTLLLSVSAAASVTLSAVVEKFAVTPQMMDGVPKSWSIDKNGCLPCYSVSTDSDTGITTYVAKPEITAAQLATLIERLYSGTNSLDLHEVELTELTFNHCLQRSIVSVILPDNISKIHAQMFSEARDLMSITVSEDNSAYSTQDGVLYNKDKTQIIKYPAKKEGDSFTLPSTVTKVSDYTFGKCSNLKSILNFNQITDTNSAYFCFSGCGVTEIVLSDSLTSIGMYTFASSKLTKITIPDSVLSIRGDAFSFCSNLQEVHMSRGTPPSFDVANNYPIFYNCNAGLKIYVPAAAVSAYKAATNWATVADKIYAGP